MKLAILFKNIAIVFISLLLLTSCGNIFESSSDDENIDHFWENRTPNAGSIKKLIVSENGQLFTLTKSLGVLRKSATSGGWEMKNNGLSSKDLLEAIEVGKNNIYVGSRSNGFFVSNNNGDDWMASSNGLPKNSSVYAIKECENGTVFCGTLGQGIYKSDDYGKNWKLSGLENYYVICINQDKSGYIYAGLDGSNGVYRSANNGVTWEFIADGLIGIPKTIKIGKDNNVYIATWNGGVFVLDTSSTKWNKISIAEYETSLNDMYIDSDGVLYISTALNGMLRYSDGTWMKFNNFDQNNSISSIAKFADRFIIGTEVNGLFNCIDFSKKWDQENFNNIITRGLVYCDDNTILASSLDGGIFKSYDNGTNWSYISGTGIYKIVTMVKSGQCLYAGGYDCILKSTNNGNTWEKLFANYSFGYVLSLHIKSNNQILAGTTCGTYISDENGANWRLLSSVRNVFTVIEDLSGNIFIGTKFDGPFVSRDGGNEWIPLSHNLIKQMPVYSIKINSKNDLFAAVWGVGILKSIDHGETWFTINNGINCWANFFSMEITLHDVIYIGTWYEGGIYKSDDSGQSWIKTNNGLSNECVHSLSSNSIGNLIAGTCGNGVFILNNRIQM